MAALAPLGTEMEDQEEDRKLRPIISRPTVVSEINKRLRSTLYFSGKIGPVSKVVKEDFTQLF